MAKSPSDAEFATWLTPAAALQRLPSDWDLRTKRDAILTRIGDSSLVALARTVSVQNRGEATKHYRMTAITSELWRDPWRCRDRAFWRTGDITFDDEPPIQLLYTVKLDDEPEDDSAKRILTFKDVRFEPASFDREFAAHLPAAQPKPDPPTDNGGALSAEEFAGWLMPPDALARLDSSWSPDTKKNWILRRLASGELRAAAKKGAIYAGMWGPRWHWYGDDFWQTGDVTFFDGPSDHFERPIPGVQSRKVEFQGVRFDPTGFPATPSRKPGGPPSVAEFEQWLMPAEALARFHPGRDEAERKRGIIRRLGNGQPRAAGYGDAGLALIPAARWRDWNVSESALWTIGDVTFSRGGRVHGGPVLFVEGREYDPPPPLESVSFLTVRFDPTRLGEGFEGSQAIAVAADQQGGGKIAGAEIERFARLYLDIWGAAATEMKALAAIRCCYPEAAIGRDSFLAKFRELRGPGKVGKPRKNNP